MSITDAVFRRRLLWTLGGVVAMVLALAAAWAARTALLIIYISALLAIGLSPMVASIERRAKLKRWTAPRWLAILSVYIVVFAVVAALGALVVPPLLEQASALQHKLPEMFRHAQQFLIERGMLPRPVTIEQAVTATASQTPQNPAIVGVVAGTIGGAIGGAFGFVTMLFLTFYLLLEGPTLFGQLWDLVPAAQRPTLRDMSRLIVSRVSAWLGANVMLAGIMGSVAAIGLGLLGEPYFYVVALIAAVGETVPVVGSIVAGIIAVAVASLVSIKLALIVGIFFLIVHETEANVLVPRLMQKRLGVTSTGLVIALLVGWEWLGVMGIVLALPTTAVLAAITEAVGLLPKEPHESGKGARSGIYPNDDKDYRS